MSDHTIFKINKFGKQKDKVVRKTNHKIYDFVTFHPAKHIPRETHCSSNTCPVSSLCVLSPSVSQGYKCICEDEWQTTQLSDGKVVCKKNTECLKHCHSGVCKKVNNTEVCECSDHWDGEFCEHYRCSRYCANDGHCLVMLKAPKQPDGRSPLKCFCKDGWMGTKCEIRKSRCLVKISFFIYFKLL